jgi:hypothetical protein
MSGITVSQRCIGESNLEFFRRILGDAVLDVAMHGHNEAYLAVKSVDNKVQAYIAVMSIKRKRLGCNNSFKYEEVEFMCLPETHNPRMAKCPLRILNKLTPTDVLFEYGTNPWRNSKAWREKAYKNIQEKINKRK